MKNLHFIFPLFLLSFLFFSCTSDTTPSKLKLVTRTNDTPLISVRLDGYTFYNFSLSGGDSKEFLLKDGVGPGYTDIKLEFVVPNSNNIIYTKRCNFEDGKTTVIDVKNLESISVYYE